MLIDKAQAHDAKRQTGNRCYAEHWLDADCFCQNSTYPWTSKHACSIYRLVKSHGGASQTIFYLFDAFSHQNWPAKTKRKPQAHLAGEYQR